MPLQDPSDPNKKQPRDLGYYKPSNTERLQKFLNDMAMLESSGGIDTDHHATSPASIHGGAKAYGKYGLMPRTMEQMMVRAYRDAEVPYEFRGLKGATGEEILAEAKTNPELEKALATKYANDMIEAGAQDEHMNHAWLYGDRPIQRGQLSELEQDMLKKPERTEKFRSLRNKLTTR
jgi:hypothetical protein